MDKGTKQRDHIQDTLARQHGVQPYADVAGSTRRMDGHTLVRSNIVATLEGNTYKFQRNLAVQPALHVLQIIRKVLDQGIQPKDTLLFMVTHFSGEHSFFIHTDP